MKAKRTVGLLTGGILDYFTIDICKGAMHVAKKQNANLILIPGKYIERDLTGQKGIEFEYQYNTLFSYPDKENVDALLILADVIGSCTTKESTRKLIEQYGDIPKVLLASKVDGYTNITYDNFHGIKEGLEYIIKVLKCKKIGMIGGPEVSVDAMERKAVFYEILKNNDIEIEDRRYISGNLSKNFNYAVKEFMDNNEDIEAVFCANDDTAVVLYEELEKRNKIPGKDVYVFAYDNAPYSARMKPPLSSVGTDYNELGEKAMEMALRMLNNEDVESKVLPTRFIKRDSLGTDNGQYGDLTKEKFKNYFHEIFYRYTYINNPIYGVKVQFDYFIEQLYQLSIADGRNDQCKDYVIRCFDDFLSNNMLSYADIKVFLRCLNKALYAFKNNEMHKSVSDEFYNTTTMIYDKIIIELDRYLKNIEEEEYNEHYGLKIFVNDIMEFEKGNDQSYMALLGHLDWLDIKNAYIYVFEEPMFHLYKEKFVVPEELFLKATLKNGLVQTVPVLQQKRKLSEIFDNDLVDEFETTMVLLPLYSNELLYGVVFCDMTEKLFENGEFLVSQMSSAVKMIQLLKTSANVQEQLEQSLAKLKENNIELDNLSKSDALTGIRNRRGFYDAAEKMLRSNRNEEKASLVAYVDMNNLKIINDKFGHDNGDFSIKLISDILTKVVSEKGITGRIGGDEFAVILPYCEDDGGESFKKEIEEQFEQFNETSDKPYLVKVSVGAYLLDLNNYMSLNEAMIHADEKLYEEKQKRTKNVLKESEL